MKYQQEKQGREKAETKLPSAILASMKIVPAAIAQQIRKIPAINKLTIIKYKKYDNSIHSLF